jgi:hypothetical protein
MGIFLISILVFIYYASSPLSLESGEYLFSNHSYYANSFHTLLLENPYHGIYPLTDQKRHPGRCLFLWRVLYTPNRRFHTSCRDYTNYMKNQIFYRKIPSNMGIFQKEI